MARRTRDGVLATGSDPWDLPFARLRRAPPPRDRPAAALLANAGRLRRRGHARSASQRIGNLPTLRTTSRRSPQGVGHLAAMLRAWSASVALCHGSWLSFGTSEPADEQRDPTGKIPTGSIGLGFEGRLRSFRRPGPLGSGRSLWNAGMLLAALVLGPLFFTWGAFAVFLALCAVTLCAGHSVGFHRRLVHRSFDARMARAPADLSRHDRRHGRPDLDDPPARHARLGATPARTATFLAHTNGLLMDGFWYLHCRLVLDHPPGFDPGPGIGDDPFYSFLNATWMCISSRSRLVLYALGGCLGGLGRVRARRRLHDDALVHLLTSRTRAGRRSGRSMAPASMRYDVPLFAIPTMGESWHNNHHAFPASARHGLYPGQFDPAFASSRCSKGSAWPGTSRRRRPCRRAKASAR